jgi:hypothetical protein
MSSPRIDERIDETGTAFDQLLVRAARKETPTDGAEDRALLALGLSAGLGAAPLATASVLKPSFLRPTTLRWISFWTVVLGGGAVALVARWDASHAVQPRSQQSAAVASPVMSSVVMPVDPPFESAPAIELPVTAAPPVTPKGPVAVPARKPSVAASAMPSAVSEPAAPCDLATEATFVQEATRALSAHDVDSASKAIDRYDARCPHGALADEAGFLRVRVLLTGSMPDDARALAQKLLDRNPHGVLAPKLEAVLGNRPIP